MLSPLTVQTGGTAPGGYRVVAGARRLAAARLAELVEVPPSSVS